MRLFVAAEVPGEVRRALAGAVEAWRDAAPDAGDGWRWTRPEGWHVTVAFLGEVDESEVEPVIDAVRAGVAGTSALSLSLRLGEVGRFGSRVLHVAVDDDPPGSLAGIGRGVQTALAEAGLPVQQRDVRGHLTLARSSRRRRIDAVPPLEIPERTWHVGEVGLYESRPQRGGARYGLLASVGLG
jgi:RNA 2',3'-cyclic 3'-phosphodiesterase